MSIITTIFTSVISVPADYQHCKTNSRAPRVICFSFSIKNCIAITLNHAHFQDKFQIAALESKGIVF